MHNMRFTIIFFSIFLLFNTVAFAQNSSPAGLWKTLDDKTGKPRSLIRISEVNGEYSAVIEKGLLETDTGESVCVKCTDERKGQRLLRLSCR